MTARVTGTLTLAGTTYAVDCVDTMDHSWGPRTERGMRAMCWSHGHFGEEYVWHVIWAKDPFAPPEDEFRLAHGYILEDGKVIGLRRGEMVARRRDDHLPVDVEIHLVDRDGREHRCTGRGLANHDWVPHNCLNVHHMFYEFTADGRTGYGVIEEAIPLDLMAEVNARAAVES
jgi:hypothetical protein